MGRSQVERINNGYTYILCHGIHAVSCFVAVVSRIIWWEYLVGGEADTLSGEIDG